jgi:carbamoyl-phosphate synthase large subunit
LANPTDLRIFAIAQALEDGYTIERIEELTKIDVWF